MPIYGSGSSLNNAVPFWGREEQVEMKKRVPVIAMAAFIFLLSGISLAAAGESITPDSLEKTGNTTVGYNAEVAYTVTIPANVTFTDTEKTVERSLLASNVMLNEGSTLKIRVASLNHFNMKYKEGYIPYEVTINHNKTPETQDYTVLLIPAGETSGWAILHFTTDLNKDHAFYAGNYTDTLTFTVTIE